MTTVTQQSPISGVPPGFVAPSNAPIAMTPEQAMQSQQFDSAMKAGKDGAKKGAERYAGLNAGTLLNDGQKLTPANIVGGQKLATGPQDILNTTSDDDEPEEEGS